MLLLGNASGTSMLIYGLYLKQSTHRIICLISEQKKKTTIIALRRKQASILNRKSLRYISLKMRFMTLIQAGNTVFVSFRVMELCKRLH